jgi:hypothetical protein
MHTAGFDLLLDLSDELLGLCALLVLEAERLVLQSKSVRDIKNTSLTSQVGRQESFPFRLFTSITFSFFFTSAFLLGAGAFLGGILN